MENNYRPTNKNTIGKKASSSSSYIQSLNSLLRIEEKKLITNMTMNSGSYSDLVVVLF